MPVSNFVIPLCHLISGSMLALLLAGCSVHAGTGVRTHTVAYAHVHGPRLVFAEPPTLVAIDHDVWVVENHEHEVFFSGGFYWVLHGGVWYHSTSYADGWVRAEARIVPANIVRIRRGTYVAYHRPHGAVVRSAVDVRVTSHRDRPGMRRGHDRKVSPSHLGDVESRGHGKDHDKRGRR